LGRRQSIASTTARRCPSARKRPEVGAFPTPAPGRPRATSGHGAVGLLTRAPREVYRVLGEEEYLTCADLREAGAGEIESSAGRERQRWPVAADARYWRLLGARRGRARSVRGSRRLRAIGMTVKLTGACAALAVAALGTSMFLDRRLRARSGARAFALRHARSRLPGTPGSSALHVRARRVRTRGRAPRVRGVAGYAPLRIRLLRAAASSPHTREGAHGATPGRSASAEFGFER